MGNMKFLVVLSLAASSFAAPVADADAQVLLGHHGLVGGVYASAPAATVAVNAAPVTAYHAVATPAVHVAAPAVAEVKTVEVKAAPAVATAVVPATYHAVAAPAVHVATAPVIQHVGYQVHHHVINHAPVV